MNFANLARENLPGDVAGRDRAIWNMAIQAENERCLAACEAERLEEPVSNEEDAAYERGIDHCMAAIRARKVGSLPSSASVSNRIAELRAELSALLELETALTEEEGKALKARCIEMARAGRYTEAVKEYRSASGLSLSEAKIALDSMLSLNTKA